MRCVNCCVRVNTVATVWLFMGIKFTWISLGFLSVKICDRICEKGLIHASNSSTLRMCN